MAFERLLYARWGDMDFNGHMKNTAYLDAAADVRMICFAENGFSMREFERLRFGPVIFRDDLEYYHELRLLDPVRITFEVAGLSEDGMRFIMRNEFFREDGTAVARVTSHGGWLDQAVRKLTVPPDGLRTLMETMDRTSDFAIF